MIWGCLLFSILVATSLPDGQSSPPPALDTAPVLIAGDSWPIYSQTADSLRRKVRLARMKLNPSALLLAETDYQEHLSFCMDHFDFTLTDQSISTRSLGEIDYSAIRNIAKHLLIARNARAERLVVDRWIADSRTFDQEGELTFWAGLAAFENEQWDEAAALLRQPVTPMLRGYADRIRFRALSKTDPDSAGALALGLVTQSVDHPFRNQLVLHAAHYLIDHNEFESARNLMLTWLDQVRSPSLRVRGQTILAEIYHREEETGAFITAVRAAGSSGLEHGSETALRLGHVREILTAAEFSDSALTGDCLHFLIGHGSTTEASLAWRNHAHQLSRPDSVKIAKLLVDRLYRARKGDELLTLVGELTATDLPLQQFCHLRAARVCRRRGDSDLLERHYHQAASSNQPNLLRSAAEKQLAALALWELGREQEDSGRWRKAATSFSELAERFPEDKNSRTSALRSAICQFRAGDEQEAHNYLDELSRLASPRQIAGPSLWRGLLSDDDEISSYLLAAAGETYPGYFALRADQALKSGYDPRHGQSDSLFWASLAQEIRDTTRWQWPRQGPELPHGAYSDILSLIENNPSAEAGIIFRAYGYNTWAAEMWANLPGQSALSHREKASLRRGMGHFYQSISLAFRDMDCLAARYPLAYAVEINQAAKRFRLSPAFVLAVMRQESMLEPVAQSSAGAKGLMQLMPDTASRLADSLRLGSVNLELPEHNILLGAAHLAELLDKTDQSVPAALAAYNGGLKNAKRWRGGPALSEDYIDWDSYIEGITYGETRRYVKSVLMHYWSYLIAYPSSEDTVGKQDD